MKPCLRLKVNRTIVEMDETIDGKVILTQVSLLENIVLFLIIVTAGAFY